MLKKHTQHTNTPDLSHDLSLQSVLLPNNSHGSVTPIQVSIVFQVSTAEIQCQLERCLLTQPLQNNEPQVHWNVKQNHSVFWLWDRESRKVCYSSWPMFWIQQNQAIGYTMCSSLSAYWKMLNMCFLRYIFISVNKSYAKEPNMSAHFTESEFRDCPPYARKRECK